MMTVLKRRTRLVYFRVSEDEFQQFTQMCEREGARCLSDLVRSAMQRAASASGGEEPVAVRLKRLDENVSQLTASLQQLAALIEQRVGNGQGEA